MKKADAIALIEREYSAITREWLAAADADEDHSGYPPFHYMVLRNRLVDAIAAVPEGPEGQG